MTSILVSTVRTTGSSGSQSEKRKEKSGPLIKGEEDSGPRP